MLRQTDSSTCQTEITPTWNCQHKYMTVYSGNIMPFWRTQHVCTCMHMVVWSQTTGSSRFWHNMTDSSQWVLLKGRCWLLSPSSIKPQPSHSSCEHGNVEVMMRMVVLKDKPIMFMACPWEHVTDQWALGREPSSVTLYYHECTPVWLSHCNN